MLKLKVFQKKEELKLNFLSEIVIARKIWLQKLQSFLLMEI